MLTFPESYNLKGSFEIFWNPPLSAYILLHVGYHYLKPCYNYYNQNYNYINNIVLTIVTITYVWLCSTDQADQENSQVQNQTVKWIKSHGWQSESFKSLYITFVVFLLMNNKKPHWRLNDFCQLLSFDWR